MVTYSPTGRDHPTILDDVRILSAGQRDVAHSMFQTLKELLVDPLPVDAYLTAIFDSCHSGTLLDLEHYTCNSVWFPWCNKGPRDVRKSRWREVREYLVLNSVMHTFTYVVASEEGWVGYVMCEVA